MRKPKYSRSLGGTAACVVQCVRETSTFRYHDIQQHKSDSDSLDEEGD